MSFRIGRLRWPRNIVVSDSGPREHSAKLSLPYVFTISGRKKRMACIRELRMTEKKRLGN